MFSTQFNLGQVNTFFWNIDYCYKKERKKERRTSTVNVIMELATVDKNSNIDSKVMSLHEFPNFFKGGGVLTYIIKH